MITATPLTPHRNPNFDRILVNVYKHIVCPGDTVADIGADVGTHTLELAEAVGSTGCVHAFEPAAPSAEILGERLEKHHQELIPRIQIHKCALANYELDSVDFILALDTPAYSGLRERKYDHPTRLARTNVALRRLDSFLEEFETLRFVKLDASGGEYEILLGATECLRRFRPLVAFEFGLGATQGYDVEPREMAEFWAKRFYRIYDLLGRPWNSSEAFAIQVAQRQDVWDFLAVPAEDWAAQQVVQTILASPY